MADLPNPGLVNNPDLPPPPTGQPATEPVPDSWKNQFRIIRMILLVDDPVRQQEIMDFVRSKLF